MTTTPDNAPIDMQALKEAAAGIAIGLDEYMACGMSTATTYLGAIMDILEAADAHLDAADPKGFGETQTHRVHRDMAAAYAQLGKAAARAIAMQMDPPDE